MSVLCRCLFFLLLSCCFVSGYAKEIELELWHAMAGSLNEELNAFAERFNQSQTQYRIKPVYKGNYTETLTSFVAAFRAHKAPAMVQVFEVGTAIMKASQSVVKPVEELMQEQAQVLPQQDFFPSVRLFYSKQGRLMALPFNLSIPLMYYNADALAKIGYGSHNFPKTWDAFETLALLLKKEGFDCAYTTAYPGWILWESFGALQGLSMPLQKKEKTVVRAHLQRLKAWQQKKYFRYAGREDDATVLFTGGVCPLFSQSSGAYSSLVRMAPFRLGTALMPFDAHWRTARKANVTGGAALWVTAGLSNDEYQGIAQFFSFLLRPEMQQKWHEHTGYLPVGLQGRYAFLLQKSKHPTLKLARNDLQHSETKQADYAGPGNQVRRLHESILEALFAGMTSPESALDKALAQEQQVRLRFLKQQLQ